jgi:hypothetical protein
MIQKINTMMLYLFIAAFGVLAITGLLFGWESGNPPLFITIAIYTAIISFIVMLITFIIGGLKG